MGDRYYLTRECVYCGGINESIYYAPTCGIFTFDCEHCGRENFITAEFDVKELEEVTLEDVEEAFSMATNVDWSEKDFKEMCREFYENLRRRVEKQPQEYRRD